MNPEVKKLWVDALRSGEYKQTIGLLRGNWSGDGVQSETGYCCLGVLTDLHAKATGKSFEECKGKHEVLGRDTQDWAGLSEANPILGNASASGHNDGSPPDGIVGRSFAEIADLIEAHL